MNERNIDIAYYQNLKKEKDVKKQSIMHTTLVDRKSDRAKSEISIIIKKN